MWRAQSSPQPARPQRTVLRRRLLQLAARGPGTLLRTCSGLRRVRFICDDSEVLVRHSTCSEIASRTKGTSARVTMMISFPLASSLARADLDVSAALRTSSALIRSDRPAGASSDRLLQLVVKDCPVGDHDDRVEDLGSGVAVEVGQPMSQPGDGIGLPDPAECWMGSVPWPLGPRADRSSVTASHW